EEDTLVEKNAVGLWARRPVRGLGDDLRLDPRGVVLADLVLDRGRNEDVAVKLEELGVRDPLRPGEPGHRARLSLVRVDAIRVEALRVGDGPARVREGVAKGAEITHEVRREDGCDRERCDQ